MTDVHRWVGGTSAVFGAWIVLSTYLFQLTSAHFWNDVIVGGAIVVLAGYSATKAIGSPGASGLAAVLGLWLIVTPFVYAGAGAAAMWSDVLSGIVVAVASGYNIYETGEPMWETSTARANA